MSSDEESEEMRPPLLMLTDAAAPAAVALPTLNDLAGVWEHRAKMEATTVMAEAGLRPGEIHFIRCHREDRRQLLLQSRVKQEWETPNLLEVVRVAMQLAKDGSIPGTGEHGRKSEFMKRCATALKALNPQAETDATSLPPQMQLLIRAALGGEGLPFEGCFSPQCLDLEPSWIKRGESSRCTRCNMLKTWGRTWTSMREQWSIYRLRRVRFTQDYARSQMGSF